MTLPLALTGVSWARASPSLRLTPRSGPLGSEAAGDVCMSWKCGPEGAPWLGNGPGVGQGALPGSGLQKPSRPACPGHKPPGRGSSGLHVSRARSGESDMAAFPLVILHRGCLPDRLRENRCVLTP